VHQLQQRTEDYATEIMITRVTAVADILKETVKKAKAQNRKREKTEKDDINNIANNKYLQQRSIKI